MKVLVLGGTRFLGRHLVRALRARHHEVTLLNRGRSAPALFPEVEQLRGDREQGADGLRALDGRRFDAVIDTCGYLPRVVRASCEKFAGAAGGPIERYVFISSISVYASLAQPDLAEDGLLALMPKPASEDVGAHYGALKAACEREVQSAFGERALVVRPGLIVGPFDPTGRFTWWLQRLARGGEALAPGVPEAPVQFIDVRDLAEWIVRALTRGPGGTFNATGPDVPLTLGELLGSIARIVRPADPASLTWCSESFLLAQGVQPWTELPLWVPAAEAGVHQVSIERAMAAGLSFRTLETTVTDTLAWVGSPEFVAPEAGAPQGRVGLLPERERQLLDAWRAQAKAAARGK